MASSPEIIQKFESKIPQVQNCCFCFDMSIGGTLLSAFGMATGFAYIARAFFILHSVHEYELSLDNDDVMNNDDDMIWAVNISTLFIGLLFLITSGFMLYGSSKAPILQRNSHHVFPFLVGILASIALSFFLGFIEVFDSDMPQAAGYLIFGAFQIYLWICALSLYRELLESELDSTKPTRTTV